MRIAAALTVLLCACGGGGDPGEDGEGGRDTIGEGEIPPNVLEKAQLGDPGLRSAQRIAFGPGGVLLVADGARDRIVAIETGEGGFGAVPAPSFVGGIRGVVAALYGDDVPESEVVVQDVAVEPMSRRVYLAAERFQGGTTEPLVAFFDHEGRLRPLATESVVWAEIRLPPLETPGMEIAALSWSGARVVAVGSDGFFTPSTVFVSDAPIRHGDRATATAPEVFHPATQQAHLDQPIFAAADYQGAGGRWLVAAFPGAPIARFRVEGFGEETARGETVFNLGSGREVRAVTASHDGSRPALWVSVFNAAFDGLLRGFRVGGDLVEGDRIDALAPTVLASTGAPVHPEVVVVPALDGAVRLASWGDGSVVVLRPDALEVVSLE